MIEGPGVAEIWAALPEARIVGGAVRDFLADKPIADVDFASPLAPEAAMARLRAAGIKTVPTGLAHGTVTAVTAGRGFEITTLRRDLAADGRHAVVAFTDDWPADARRRDFTINAMSMARDGAVHDYFAGRDDLAAGRVRFVGEAAARVREDYLRILRFFRFFARYGRGAPDAAAVAAVSGLKDGLARLSVERVWAELKGLLGAADPGAAVLLMEATGVLPMVVPGADVGRLAALLGRGAPADPLLRLAALLRGDGAAFADEKKLSLAERDRLAALRRPMALAPEADEAALRRALAEEPAELLIARSWLAGDERGGWDGLRARLAAARRPVFPLRGKDLLALGYAAGPELGRRLMEARAWWMEGGCVAGRGACLAYLQGRRRGA